MSAASLQPNEKNGSERVHAGGKGTPRANGTARKRSTPKPKSEDRPNEEAASPQEPAGFVSANIQTIDAEMWPIQPVIWWQPEWNPGLPAMSDLRVERTHRIPAPGFLNLGIQNGYRPEGIEAERNREGAAVPPPLPPQISPMFPESGLTLLGWDPRAIIPRGNE